MLLLEEDGSGMELFGIEYLIPVHREFKEQMVLKDLREPKVQQEHKVFKELLELKVFKDLLVLQVHKVI
jgi:hypothetical protein